MNTKTKSIRSVFALVLVISALGISTTTVLADKPIMYEFGPFTEEGEISGVCSFPVSLSSTATLSGIDFVDKSGVITRTHWHFVAQDTLTANGKTLVGIPYTYNITVLWDSFGNPTGWYLNGVFEKIPLPDKGLYNPAGRSDLTENIDFTLSPDNGTSGNVAGFCAALSQ